LSQLLLESQRYPTENIIWTKDDNVGAKVNDVSDRKEGWPTFQSDCCTGGDCIQTNKVFCGTQLLTAHVSRGRSENNNKVTCDMWGDAPKVNMLVEPTPMGLSKGCTKVSHEMETLHRILHQTKPASASVCCTNKRVHNFQSVHTYYWHTNLPPILVTNASLSSASGMRSSRKPKVTGRDSATPS
jgi:hypothetical protein